MSQPSELQVVEDGIERTGAAPRQRRHSLMLTLLAILVLVAVVPIVLMGYNISAQMEDDLAANQKELELETIATAIERDILNHVESQFDRMRHVGDAITAVVANQVERGGPDRVPVADIRRLLEEYLDADSALFFELSFADAAQPALRVHVSDFDPEAVEAQLEPLVARGRDKGRRGIEFLSNPVLPAAHRLQPLAVLAVPVGRAESTVQGGDRGVLVGVVNLAAVQRTVQAEGDTSNGYTIFVLDSENRPFAHTQFLRVFERDDHSGNPLVQEFSKLGMAASSLEFELTEDGKRREMIGAFAPIPLKDHRWGVFLQVDRQVGLYQVSAMRKMALKWGLVAFGLAVAFGIAFSLRLSGPIHALTESTRRVAGGEYGKRVSVKNNNEIGMLADNFNLMSEEIRRTIDGLHHQRELNEQLFISSIRSLAAAIDARDPYTRGHSERVTRFARIIARQMKLTPARVRNIEIGALLHDVGKIGIEDRILRKPSALTPEEFEIMKTHPEKGGDIMEPISFLREATEIIVHHHERWDGTGYPSGLTGDEIPLGARVVQVADTFDAMTTNRPYQRAMPFEVAARKITDFAGKACDPAVVNAFLEAMEEGLFDVVGEQSSQVS